jgi:hypothetical protein
VIYFRVVAILVAICVERTLANGPWASMAVRKQPGIAALDEP